MLVMAGSMHLSVLGQGCWSAFIRFLWNRKKEKVNADILRPCRENYPQHLWKLAPAEEGEDAPYQQLSPKHLVDLKEGDASDGDSSPKSPRKTNSAIKSARTMYWGHDEGAISPRCSRTRVLERSSSHEKLESS